MKVLFPLPLFENDMKRNSLDIEMEFTYVFTLRIGLIDSTAPGGAPFAYDGGMGHGYELFLFFLTSWNHHKNNVCLFIASSGVKRAHDKGPLLGDLVSQLLECRKLQMRMRVWTCVELTWPLFDMVVRCSLMIQKTIILVLSFACM